MATPPLGGLPSLIRNGSPTPSPRDGSGRFIHLDTFRILSVSGVVWAHLSDSALTTNAVYGQNWGLQILLVICGMLWSISKTHPFIYALRLAVFFLLGVFSNWLSVVSCPYVAGIKTNSTDWSPYAIVGSDWKSNIWDIIYQMWFVFGLLFCVVSTAPMKWALNRGGDALGKVAAGYTFVAAGVLGIVKTGWLKEHLGHIMVTAGGSGGRYYSQYLDYIGSYQCQYFSVMALTSLALAFLLRSPDVKKASDPKAERQSISEIIQIAIADGGPAYNRGDKPSCVRTYKAAAQQLLGTYRVHLSPEVVRDLEKPFDKLAWSLRFTFDTQLGKALRPGNSEPLLQRHQAISEIIQKAIALGGPAYNARDIVGCAGVYEDAAQQLLATYHGDLPPEVARDLAHPGDNDELAFAFRHAFDKQLRQEKASSTANPVHEFIRTRGTEFIAWWILLCTYVPSIYFYEPLGAWVHDTCLFVLGLVVQRFSMYGQCTIATFISSYWPIAVVFPLGVMHIPYAPDRRIDIFPYHDVLTRARFTGMELLFVMSFVSCATPAEPLKRKAPVTMCADPYDILGWLNRWALFAYMCHMAFLRMLPEPFNWISVFACSAAFWAEDNYLQKKEPEMQNTQNYKAPEVFGYAWLVLLFPYIVLQWSAFSYFSILCIVGYFLFILVFNEIRRSTYKPRTSARTYGWRRITSVPDGVTPLRGRIDPQGSYFA